MITIKVRKKNGSYEEFISKGHAGYAEAGQDIVCAAVSALIITTVNSLEKFTDDKFDVQEKDGFVSIHSRNDLSERGIYTDLMREFICHGHRVYMVVPAERRFHESTSIKESCGAQILRVKTLNIQKSNVVEKGIGTLLLEMQYQCAIKRYWKDIQFDLILYSTPPITFNRVISSQKKRCKAKSYLLLKDIFYGL